MGFESKINHSQTHAYDYALEIGAMEQDIGANTGGGLLVAIAFSTAHAKFGSTDGTLLLDYLPKQFDVRREVRLSERPLDSIFIQWKSSQKSRKNRSNFSVIASHNHLDMDRCQPQVSNTAEKGKTARLLQDTLS